MIATSEYVRLLFLALAMCTGASGCASHMSLEDLGRTMTLAVAPALNHSGSQDFDPLRAADLMASELTFFPGVKVIPLNRTLAQLEAQGKANVESPGHALQLMDRVGADGIVVFAVTEFEPYFPPVVGISAQLYGYGAERPSGFDPVSASRWSSPFEAGYDMNQPRGQYQRVFHGGDQQVVEDMKHFAKQRAAPRSPHGWRKFMVSQDDFWRFCCHAVAQQLIRQEVTHVQAQLDRQEEVAEP